MPLIKSGSKSAISTNIREMQDAGHPHDQAVAAALSTARRYGRRDGGRTGYKHAGKVDASNLMDYNNVTQAARTAAAERDAIEKPEPFNSTLVDDGPKTGWHPLEDLHQFPIDDQERAVKSIPTIPHFAGGGDSSNMEGTADLPDTSPSFAPYNEQAQMVAKRMRHENEPYFDANSAFSAVPVLGPTRDAISAYRRGDIDEAADHATTAGLQLAAGPAARMITRIPGFSSLPRLIQRIAPPAAIGAPGFISNLQQSEGTPSAQAATFGGPGTMPKMPPDIRHNVQGVKAMPGPADPPEVQRLPEAMKANARLQVEARNAGFYHGPIDGVIRPGGPTEKALGDYRVWKDAQEKARVESERASGEQKLKQQEAERLSKEAGAREAEAQAKIQREQREREDAVRLAHEREEGNKKLKEIDDKGTGFVQKYGPAIGYGAGIILGGITGRSNTAFFNRLNRLQTERSNLALTQNEALLRRNPGTIQPRARGANPSAQQVGDIAANLNQVNTEGQLANPAENFRRIFQRRPTPTPLFTTDQGNTPPVALNPRHVPNAQTYLPGRTPGEMRAAGVEGLGWTADVAYFQHKHSQAVDDLNAARAELLKHPNDQSAITHYTDAKDSVALYESLLGMGRMGLTAHGVTSLAVPPNRTRPNIGQADAQLTRILPRIQPLGGPGPGPGPTPLPPPNPAPTPLTGRTVNPPPLPGPGPAPRPLPPPRPRPPQADEGTPSPGTRPSGPPAGHSEVPSDRFANSEHVWRGPGGRLVKRSNNSGEAGGGSVYYPGGKVVSPHSSRNLHAGFPGMDVARKISGDARATPYPRGAAYAEGKAVNIAARAGFDEGGHVKSPQEQGRVPHYDQHNDYMDMPPSVPGHGGSHAWHDLAAMVPATWGLPTGFPAVGSMVGMARQAIPFSKIIARLGGAAAAPAAGAAGASAVEHMREAETPSGFQHHADGGMAKRDAKDDTRHDKRGKVFAGPIEGPTGGRADKVPMTVRSGAYVWPADVVSGCGQGNTEAGQKYLASLEQHAVKTHRSGGGSVAALAEHSRAPGVPIKAAHGERVTPPETVAAFGGGDIDRGHQICDALVKQLRQRTIDTLKNLPPPSK